MNLRGAAAGILVFIAIGRGGSAWAQAGMDSESFGRGVAVTKEAPAPPLTENPADPRVYRRFGLDGDPDFRKALALRQSGVATLAVGLTVGGLSLLTGLVINGLAHMSWGPSTASTSSGGSSDTPGAVVPLIAAGGIVAAASLVGGVAQIQHGTTRMQEIYRRRVASPLPQVSLGAGSRGGSVAARWRF